MKKVIFTFLTTLSLFFSYATIYGAILLEKEPITERWPSSPSLLGQIFMLLIPLSILVAIVSMIALIILIFKKIRGRVDKFKNKLLILIILILLPLVLQLLVYENPFRIFGFISFS